MLTSDGALIQVTIGPGIAGATTQADLDAAASAAAASLAAKGIALPAALITSDDQAPAQSVTIAIRVSTQASQAASLDEVSQLLVEQVSAIATNLKLGNEGIIGNMKLPDGSDDDGILQNIK